MKAVSVIVPAHNEARFIQKSIESLLEQTYYPIEIVVVADNCTDDTYGIAKLALKDYQFSKVLKGEHGCAAGTRNAGAVASEGEILIFHDADCFADKKMVEKVVDRLEKGYDGVATKTDVVEPKTILEQAIKAERAIGWDMTQKEAIEIKKGAPVLVANMTRLAFDKLNGFNEKIFYFEDQNLTDRFFDAGFKACFDPEVIEYHNDPSTISEQIDQSLQNGKGIRTLVKQGKFHKLLIPLYPIVFLFGVGSLFVGNILLGALLLLPMFALYIILLEKSDDTLGVVAFLPLFLMRNVFKLIGLIKG